MKVAFPESSMKIQGIVQPVIRWLDYMPARTPGSTVLTEAEAELTATFATNTKNPKVE